MEDRELLELAAKAAGHGKVETLKVCGEWVARTKEGFLLNYLHDDGAALRLSAKLRFTVKIADHECEVFDNNAGGCLYSIGMHHPEEEEVLKTTREAIVRAAAEIGKAMQ